MTLALTIRSLAAALTLACAGGAFAADRIALPDAAPAEAVVILIDKMKYGTPDLTVKVGDTVTWVNQETMPHNVAFKKGVVGDEAFQGPMLKKAQTFSITFNETGAFEYFCTPHPFMRGKVTVE